MRIVIAYKNFAANKGVSHIGLGVSAMHNAKTLSEAGYPCEVWPIVDANQLRMALRHDQSKPYAAQITHVVISAPWIATQDIAHLCSLFPRTQFVVNSHSNVGFLQADSNGMRLIREALDLELSTSNFRFAGNSDKFCRWVREAYGSPCQYLPNLYHPGQMDHSKRPRYDGGTLRIGIFGAVRPQKNVASAAAAAMQIARELKVETEVWVSGGRQEGGGEVVMRTVREMLRDVPGITLRESPWQTWPGFRRLIGSMHLLLQPSYTESFNMVTADGIAEGVPSVVSDAIDWVPSNWRAHFDEVTDIARVGERLLFSRCAPIRGKRALHKYRKRGLKAWIHYLHETHN